MAALPPLPLALLALALPPAQELVRRDFGTRDGLAHERVNAIVEDPRGYLWIATWEGVSRFDGREFTSYGRDEGLAPPLVFTLAFDPEGRLWASPHGEGLARLDPREPAPRFRAFRVGDGPAENEVEALLFDERGAWAAAPAGVFRAAEREEPRFEAAWRAEEGGPLDPQAAFRAAGRGWIACVERVLELDGERVRERPGPLGGAPRDHVAAAAGADGRALLVTRERLVVFDAHAAARGEEPFSPVELELAPDEIVHATAIDARGRLWLATVRGLVVADGARARRAGTAQGLADEWLRALALDRSGRAWIGSNQGGLAYLREPPIASFLGRGRERANVVRVVEAADGATYATANDRGIARLGPDGLETLPGGDAEPFRGVHLGFLRDRDGDWWLGGAGGTWRVRGPGLDLARAEPVPLDGGAFVKAELWQDPRGRIWTGGSDDGLYACDPRAQAPRFERVLEAAALGGAFPRAFASGAGWTWIATNSALFRAPEGDPARVERVEPGGGVSGAELEPRALLVDSRGWLWVGTRHAGAAWTREPLAERPVFERIGARDGLPSEHVLALADDRLGRVWLGTGRGLVRYDPRPDSGEGALRRFSTADGLAGETVNDLALGRDGVLWAAVGGGLSRVDPALEPAPSAPPPVHVRAFRAGARELSVPAAGAARLAGIELGAGERSVSIAYAGIDLAGGAELRYELRLEGLDERWSAPSAETTARYGSLAPGAYRFLVRARTADGVASAEPASVEFTIAAPLWRRAWFLAACALACAAAAWAAAALRARRRAALERVRSQIAADLHDEVGAGLAQIAVLAEVARRAASLGRADGGGAELGEVAELARATRSSMADLVWAIDPRRDTLRDLVQRLRGVTANLFGGEGLELVLRVPGDDELDGVALAPDRRRQLLLFFKEAAHNVARHAGAGRVEIALALAGGRVRLSVCDDGRGFDPASPAAGTGLASLRRRAQALGGTLVIDSAPGRGTRVELDAPL